MSQTTKYILVGGIAALGLLGAQAAACSFGGCPAQRGCEARQAASAPCPYAAAQAEAEAEAAAQAGALEADADETASPCSHRRAD